jgi:cytochrome c oxidase subunit 2
MHLSLLFAQAVEPAQNLSTFSPVSPPAEWIRYLAIFVLAISGLIFLIVEGVLIYSLVRFRRKPSTLPTEPPQVYGSMPIELAWTVGPALIVFLLLLVVIRTELEIRKDPNTPPEGSKPLRVTVIGHQWWWEYQYTQYEGEPLNVITANELHVPASGDVVRPVYLRLESVDVCHSFWVPRLAGKTDLLPGRANDTWFQTAKPGLYLGQCAEFCGSQHANMLLRVEVQPPDEFQKWLDNQKTGEATEAKKLPGRDVFMTNACVNCHRIAGTPADHILGGEAKPGTRFGPDLTHLASRQTIASGIVPNTAEELERWIIDPQKVKPGCWMPAMNLSKEDVNKVVEYLRALQ